MDRKSAIAVLALSLGGCLALTAPAFAAEQGQQQGHQQQQKSSQGKSGGGSNAGAQRGGGNKNSGVVRNGGSNKSFGVMRNRTRTTTPRTTAKQKVYSGTPKAFTQPKFRVAKPNSVTQHKFRTATPRNSAPKIVSPDGGDKRFTTAGRLRGVGKTSIRGRNFSVWRSKHRVRHGGGWRTFVALGTLSAIVIGTSEYYPYAYISASQPYCEGYTRDSCELRWQEVETIEGDTIYQCVAYCPWQ